MCCLLFMFRLDLTVKHTTRTRAHALRAPKTAAAAAVKHNAHNAHNLRTPKHGSRYRYGRRRGRHNLLSEDCCCCSTQRAED